MSHLSLRVSLLALVWGGAMLTFGKVVLFPAVATDSTTSFPFPRQVPLPGWQLVASRSLTGKGLGDSQYRGGQYYHYSQGRRALEIEMHYLSHTDGDVAAFFKTQAVATSQSSQSQQRQSQQSQSQQRQSQQRQSVNGYYRLSTTQNQAYLNACINPYGGSTVTSMQFKQNRNTYDVSQRFLPWLLGQGKLQDNRCLWAKLSVPLQQSSPASAYQTLESAWFSWQQWWQQHFPPA